MFVVAAASKIRGISYIGVIMVKGGTAAHNESNKPRVHRA